MPAKRSDFNSQTAKKRYNRAIKRQAAAMEKKGKLPQFVGEAQRFVKPFVSPGNGKGYSSEEAVIEKKLRPLAEEPPVPWRPPARGTIHDSAFHNHKRKREHDELLS